MDDSARQDVVADRALRSLRRIVRQVSSHARTVAKQTGLTVPAVLCLRAIDDLSGGDTTVAAVAEVVQLSRSSVSVVVDKLVRAGLVDRDRSEVDRRRVVLTLTADGRAQIKDLPMPLQDGFVRRLAALPEEEQELLLSALERIVGMMDAEDLDAAPMLVPGHVAVPPVGR